MLVILLFSLWITGTNAIVFKVPVSSLFELYFEQKYYKIQRHLKVNWNETLYVNRSTITWLLEKRYNSTVNLRASGSRPNISPLRGNLITCSFQLNLLDIIDFWYMKKSNLNKKTTKPFLSIWFSYIAVVEGMGDTYWTLIWKCVGNRPLGRCRYRW
jgi:hypothetical protein